MANIIEAVVPRVSRWSGHSGAQAGSARATDHVRLHCHVPLGVAWRDARDLACLLADRGRRKAAKLAVEDARHDEEEGEGGLRYRPGGQTGASAVQGDGAVWAFAAQGGTESARGILTRKSRAPKNT